MKRIITLICCVLSLQAFTNVTAVNADDILGTWLSENGEAQIQIYKEADAYFGKIVWLKSTIDPKRGGTKVDYNNPDPALRTKPILGLVMLRGFKFSDGEWSGGRVYDPQNGKDYRCYMKLKDSKTLSMRGYIGILLLGRTEVWTRVK